LGDELARPLADGLDGVACGYLQGRQRNFCRMFHVGPLLADQGGGDIEADQGTVPVHVRLLDGRLDPCGIVEHPGGHSQGQIGRGGVGRNSGLAVGLEGDAGTQSRKRRQPRDSGVGALDRLIDAAAVSQPTQCPCLAVDRQPDRLRPSVGVTLAIAGQLKGVRVAFW